ncbi:MAG: DUF1501 domain-containing protein [Lentisphaeraceae bacterium]|nr:DUF1501 domain-containing protein [Lentisphaeraceae bacterium]
MNRRNFLKSSASLTAMLTAGNTFAARDKAERKLNHFIFINLVGAPSQFESFDPKPGTANGGPTKAVNTRIANCQFADNFGNLAELTNNIAVMRMTSKEGNHERAQYFLQSGGYIPVGALKHSSMSSISGWGMENKTSIIPPTVGIGRGTRSAGYLGRAYDAFVVDNPEKSAENILPSSFYKNKVDNGTNIRNLYVSSISPGLAGDDFLQEKKLQSQAARLGRHTASEVFDLNKETATVKRKYGENFIGNSCLLAKRLVNSGVPSVQINYGNWDTHADNFQKTSELARPLDDALSSLIKDLQESGKYKETAILVAGEFGRTPRINGNDGRDHYAQSWSAILASGAVKGQLIGLSNNEGTQVSNGITVPQLSFALYSLMGMNPNKWINTSSGRPIKLSPGKEGIPAIG